MALVAVTALAFSSCAVGVRQLPKDVTSTGAELWGFVGATHDGPGSYFVEYGTGETSQRTPTRSVNFVPPEKPAVIETVQGLEPDTTYWYKVCAEDADHPGDPHCSPKREFTTDPPGTESFSTEDGLFPGSLRNQGWWSDIQTNYNPNANYIAGRAGRPLGESRNYFTFDLTSACAAESVTLKLTRFRQTGTLDYTLFDVSTPAAVLNQKNGANPAIFEDLGSGTSFGTFAVAPGDEADLLRFSLNAAGVSAFNAARGGYFSVGGRSSGEGAPEESYLFGFSGFTADPRIVAACEPG